MKSARRQQGKPVFELIEEAVHLLRTTSVATLAVYYAGTIPFTLGFLYFWADMSRSPFARSHLAGATFGLTALFGWMKWCQVFFARNLRAQIAGQTLPASNFRQNVRILLMQTILQPFGLFLLPLAALPILPFVWVYAFFQNVTALADDGSGGTWKLLKKSWQQATLWPAQNSLALLSLGAFAFCVFLNWASVCLLLPQLAKMLFGVRSIFTDSPMSALNTTFFAGMIALTYLCVDPIFKTVYVLRCFYGESLQSGEDLKAGLKPFALSFSKRLAILTVFFALSFTPSLTAADTSPPVTAPTSSPIAPLDLDHAINQTIHEHKYTWRMPRKEIVDDGANEGVIARFFDNVGTMLRDGLRGFVNWWKAFMDKLFPGHHPVSSSSANSGYGWIMSLQVLLYGLVALVLAALAVFLIRLWQARRRPAATVASIVLQPVPDITDENVRADQLPEDGWTKLARELLERGEFRLAMRAFYLASLSHLAARNLISIARFKSNRDYERELRRRAHSFPNLLSVFGDNLFSFERGWYGTHAVSRESVDAFSVNVEKIKAAG
jgi:hypothetical protein